MAIKISVSREKENLFLILHLRAVFGTACRPFRHRCAAGSRSARALRRCARTISSQGNKSSNKKSNRASRDYLNLCIPTERAALAASRSLAPGPCSCSRTCTLASAAAVWLPQPQAKRRHTHARAGGRTRVGHTCAGMLASSDRWRRISALATAARKMCRRASDARVCDDKARTHTRACCTLAHGATLCVGAEAHAAQSITENRANEKSEMKIWIARATPAQTVRT